MSILAALGVLFTLNIMETSEEGTIFNIRGMTPKRSFRWSDRKVAGTTGDSCLRLRHPPWLWQWTVDLGTVPKMNS